MRCAMASRQAPQSVPAPQQAATASTLLAPARTAASISRSVTARQMQRTMALPEIETDSQFQAAGYRSGSAGARGRRALATQSFLLSKAELFMDMRPRP